MVNPAPSSSALRIFLIAGEASGDLYGGMLVDALRTHASAKGFELDVRGWGGDAMNAAGMKLLTPLDSLNFMGFVEVLRHLPTVASNLRRAVRDIHAFDPHVTVFIDFPGFNMRVQRRLRAAGHTGRRVQWVAPQVWAWNAGRRHALARDTHAVAPLLPFEAPMLKEAGVTVWDEGHPLLDLLHVREAQERRSLALALLPGSRAQELRSLLPVLVQAALEGCRRGKWERHEVVVAGAPGRSLGDYHVARDAGFEVVFGQTHALLSRAQLAWVASGTATLEAALLRTPQVIVYRTSALTYRLAKALAKVAWIGLPNLVLGRAWVPELIQHACTSDNLLDASERVTKDSQLNANFAELAAVLGGSGSVGRLAERVVREAQLTGWSPPPREAPER